MANGGWLRLRIFDVRVCWLYLCACLFVCLWQGPGELWVWCKEIKFVIWFLARLTHVDRSFSVLFKNATLDLQVTMPAFFEGKHEFSCRNMLWLVVLTICVPFCLEQVHRREVLWTFVSPTGNWRVFCVNVPKNPLLTVRRRQNKIWMKKS